MSVNKVILVGNLGAEPEVRTAPSGTAVGTLRVATNMRWTDAAGRKQEATEWHRVVVWGRVAEVAQQFLTKGRQVFVEGRIQTRQWQDKTGQKRYSTEIVAQNLQLLGSKPDETEPTQPGEPAATEAALPADVEQALAGSSFAKE